MSGELSPTMAAPSCATIKNSPATSAATNAAIARTQFIAPLRNRRLVLDNTVCAAHKANAAAGAILRLGVRIVT